jgi:acyl-CoA hydrolase
LSGHEGLVAWSLPGSIGTGDAVTAPRIAPLEAIERIAKAAAVAAAPRVALPGGAAEALCLVEAWRAAPEHARGLIFNGLLVPGVNRTDYAALGAGAAFETVILSPDWRNSFAAGLVKHFPLHYSAAFARLQRAPFAAAVLHVSPPDAAGRCSFGLAADSGPAFGDHDARLMLRIGMINHAMPHVADGPSIALARFDAIVEGEWPLIETDSVATAPDAIATRVADFVEDGATVQIGIGKLPGAILAALRHRRGLHIHSGLVPGALADLLDTGAIADAPGAITTGLVLGDHAFQRRLANDPRLRMTSVHNTHGIAALAAIENFVAINAALEVDLFGQVNGELAVGRQIAGTGGMADFVRGAAASRGGRALIALSASGKSGDSRIVPRLAGPVTLSRADAPILVSEHGVADLAGLDANARAGAIIAIAAPTHRESLVRAWRDMRSQL